MAGGQTPGGAGAAAAGADTLAVEQQQDGFGLAVGKAEVASVRQAGILGSVPGDSGDGVYDFLFHAVTQITDAGNVLLHAGGRHFSGFAKGNDLGDVFGASPPAVFLAAAHEVGLPRYTLAGVK